MSCGAVASELFEAA